MSERGNAHGAHDPLLPRFGANLYSYAPVQRLLAEALQGIVTSHDAPGFGLTERWVRCQVSAVCSALALPDWVGRAWSAGTLQVLYCQFNCRLPWLPS